MIEYSKVNAELIVNNWKNIKNALKKKIETTLRMNFIVLYFLGFLGSLLSKIAGPLIKVAVPLAKNILAPLGITAAA